MLTPDDLAAICAQADPLSAADGRDQAITWSLYTGACRLGEHLKWVLRDLDWTDDTLAAIFVRYPEKDSEHRRVRIYGRAAVSLRTYLHYHRPTLLHDRSDPGFLWLSERGTAPLHPSNYRAKLVRWAEAAGIPFRVTPHTMRHTAATDLANGGADPEDLRQYLGWRQYQTAIHYIHRSGRSVLERIARAQPALPVGHVEDRV